MEATEICPLSKRAVQDLLDSRVAEAELPAGSERRRAPRWPFAGTVELWVPEEDGSERYTLGTCIDLSARGLGIRCDENLPVGMTLSVAIHQPEVSFHGKAVVRHQSALRRGEFALGLQFCYEPS